MCKYTSGHKFCSVLVIYLIFSPPFLYLSHWFYPQNLQILPLGITFCLSSLLTNVKMETIQMHVLNVKYCGLHSHELPVGTINS